MEKIPVGANSFAQCASGDRPGRMNSPRPNSLKLGKVMDSHVLKTLGKAGRKKCPKLLMGLLKDKLQLNELWR